MDESIDLSRARLAGLEAIENVKRSCCNTCLEIDNISMI